MQDVVGDILQTALRRHWSRTPSDKAKPYVDAFFDTMRIGTKIIAKVRGNHGTYTVSIHLNQQTINAACSCYIGKGGGCHHSEALAHTFLNNPDMFRAHEQLQFDDIQTLADLHAYLQNTTLDTLLTELKSQGITHKAFADSIGMSTRHLSAIKSSELRHHYFHELGATKLACIWVLTHIAQARVK
jgi:hypothetical protein